MNISRLLLNGIYISIMRKRRKNNLLQGTADGHKQSRLLQDKKMNSSGKRLFIFCLLPPTGFMQVYQLFFAPLPGNLNFIDNQHFAILHPFQRLLRSRTFITYKFSQSGYRLKGSIPHCRRIKKNYLHDLYLIFALVHLRICTNIKD